MPTPAEAEAPPARTKNHRTPRQHGSDATGTVDQAHEASAHVLRDWLQRFGASPDPSPLLVSIPDIGPTCELLLADSLLADLDPQERFDMVAWIRDQQREDGAWTNLAGEVDLSLTVFGWWARRQAGDDPHQESMAAARRRVLELGGAQRGNFAVRLWLAMSGTIPWSSLPAVPTALWTPRFSQRPTKSSPSPWAREMLTAYQLLTLAPTRLHVPDADPLLLRDVRGVPITPRIRRSGIPEDLLAIATRSHTFLRQFSSTTADTRAKRACLHRMHDTQQAHGGWFSVRPTLLSLLALRVHGASSKDSRILAGLRYLRRARGWVQYEGQRHWAQGISGPERSVEIEIRAALGQNQTPDLRHLPLSGEPLPALGSYWPLEPGADRHADLDTTCAAIGALGAGVHGETRGAESRDYLRQALAAVMDHQRKNGSFGRFEASEITWADTRFPWGDSAQVATSRSRGTDEREIVRTAQAIRALATPTANGCSVSDSIKRGITWLEQQFTIGSSQWSTATLCHLARCVASLSKRDHPFRTRVERALRRRQHESGGAGSILETAQMLLALLDLDGPCVQAQRAAFSLSLSILRGELISLSHTRLTVHVGLRPGFGLSPRLRDPSAESRACCLALAAYRSAHRPS